MSGTRAVSKAEPQDNFWKPLGIILYAAIYACKNALSNKWLGDMQSQVTCVIGSHTDDLGGAEASRFWPYGQGVTKVFGSVDLDKHKCLAAWRLSVAQRDTLVAAEVQRNSSGRKGHFLIRRAH